MLRMRFLFDLPAGELGRYAAPRPPGTASVRLYVHCSMAALRFTWDAAKGRANLSKHGISFEEAETVFSDDHAILVHDPDHSEAEERFLLIGLSSALRVLVVVHCEPGPDRTIRLRSARRATRSERGQYAA